MEMSNIVPHEAITSRIYHIREMKIMMEPQVMGDAVTGIAE
jgi:hypothetical protein